MAEHRNRNLAGIMLAAVSSLLVILLGAVGKKLGGELSPFVIVFLYSLFSFVTFLPAALRGGGFRRVASRVPGMQTIRAAIFAAALIGWFWALPKVPLADLTAIGYASSLFTLVGAILFLGEASLLWRWLALAVGFGGMLVVLKPGFAEISGPMLAIVAVSAGMAAARLCNKIVTRIDSPVVLVFWHNGLTTLFSLPTALIFWQSPSPDQWLWLLLMGLIGTSQQLIGAWAIKFADFGVIEPVNFLKLVWAAVLGFIFFAEVPPVSTILGGAIIVGAVVYIAQRERREAKVPETLDGPGAGTPAAP
ncbi:MAG: DMT family transporter [Rhodospirillales bacterium]|jgi:drug/metabolite transporter (DMT)-like permease|nr:DMT family transporter [Rhodospirillales bacterium]MDP6843038.1 DMT family transporter [Rhodospirillales bacterium]